MFQESGLRFLRTHLFCNPWDLFLYVAHFNYWPKSVKTKVVLDCRSTHPFYVFTFFIRLATRSLHFCHFINIESQTLLDIVIDWQYIVRGNMCYGLYLCTLAIARTRLLLVSQTSFGLTKTCWQNDVIGPKSFLKLGVWLSPLDGFGVPWSKFLSKLPQTSSHIYEYCMVRCTEKYTDPNVCIDY